MISKYWIFGGYLVFKLLEQYFQGELVHRHDQEIEEQKTKVKKPFKTNISNNNKCPLC